MRGVDPPLDEGFISAVQWNRAYSERVASQPDRTPIVLAVTRADGTVYRERIEILPHESDNIGLDLRYLERIVKLLLWMKGGSEIVIAGHDELAREIADVYRPQGQRAQRTPRRVLERRDVGDAGGRAAQGG
jgi:hypothetical protein